MLNMMIRTHFFPSPEKLIRNNQISHSNVCNVAGLRPAIIFKK